jgi:hypothetical protein
VTRDLLQKQDNRFEAQRQAFNVTMINRDNFPLCLSMHIFHESKVGIFPYPRNGVIPDMQSGNIMPTYRRIKQENVEVATNT